MIIGILKNFALFDREEISVTCDIQHPFKRVRIVLRSNPKKRSALRTYMCVRSVVFCFFQFYGLSKLNCAAYWKEAPLPG